MPDVRIDYQVLNQIAGSLKNLSVDLAANTTWEDDIAELAGTVWDATTANHVREAVETMIGDWDYARSVLSLQAMTAAQKADIIGAAWADWDFGVGERGETALYPGAWESAGGEK
ncbi:hypothetical protein [Ruania alba]|uniref:Uncharacterized protein n=1 Tax=Ruania alba TaxID=648782 RepID=A0A1H5M1T4_9MICO|nr:hypothetical protein [Ruania alba]SEE83273.1 hypothetical protein SAMN04488554_3103 [Ruania alba]